MINVEFKMFIDRPGVEKRVNRKRRRVLARSGGYGRQTMRRQMRPAGKKGKKSKPNEPPRTIVGLIKKMLYFGLADDGESVVIGPAKIGQAKGNRLLGGKETVPELLNEGGKESLLFPDGKRETVNYEPRPFVDPVRPTIEDFYKQQIEETPL